MVDLTSNKLVGKMDKVIIKFVISALFLLASRSVDAGVVRDYDLDIRMPSVVSYKEDSLVCTGVQLQPDEAYIVKFTPHASKTTAHHMMVYGCKTPASDSNSWHCDQSDLARSEHSVCANGEERQVLFAWALDAPDKALPKDVGLRIAGETDIKTIIVQLHYTRKFTEGETDNSGITLHVTNQRPPQQMGYYVLGSAQEIEPQQREVHIETGCQYNGEYSIYPIGYRTHSHDLGILTAGYRIRDGKWTEIGRMSPQLPETFYNVTNPGMEIKKGDLLASRCTMTSLGRKDFTFMGPTHQDEMCNFYIMFSTYNQENLKTQMCFPHNHFSWAKDFKDYMPPPPNVSSLDGIANADYVREKFRKMISS